MESTEHCREVLEHEHASEEAIRIIKQAAEAELLKIANAAALANGVVAAAAAAAANDKSKISGDHDLLVRLETLLEVLQKQVSGLSEGIFKQYDGHELRIKTLENSKIRQNVTMGIGIFILTTLVGMLVWHILQVPVK